MSPAGVCIEYNIGINNKFSLLSNEVSESNKSNKKPKNIKKPELTQKVAPKIDKPKTKEAPVKLPEKPKDQVNEVKKVDTEHKKPTDGDNKKQVKFQYEKRPYSNFKREGTTNDADKHVSNNKPREEQNAKGKNHNVRVQTIVVESSKPVVEPVESNTAVVEDVNKENHRRSNFNRKQARLDKGKDVFDDRGKRVYDRHSGQVKSSVKSSYVKKEHLNELDNQKSDDKTNTETTGDDQRMNKSYNDVKPTETEEVSKEISYAEYKKNLVSQGNVDITKIYSSESKVQSSNSTKNVDSTQTTDKTKKNQKVKKDKSTIDIEVDSSIKTAESYIVKNARPNNKNFRPNNNFKNKQFNDRQKPTKDKKSTTVVAPPSLNLTDEFPSL